MTNRTKLLLGAAAAVLLLCAAAGNIYYETLPGLVVKHPVTGVTTLTINGTNGTIFAGQILSRSGVGRVAVAGDHSITTNEFFVAVTAPCQLTFPAANAVPAGHWITIKDSGANTVTNTPAGSDTFDGVTESDILTLRSSVQYISDGVSNWERN